MSTSLPILNGRYRLDRQVGQGGFARVYLATDLRLARQVAVKVLEADLAAGEQRAEFLARFEREARAIAALDHDHILGVHDYGEVDGRPYLVMPFVAGGSLDDRLRRAGRLRPDEAAVYLRQVAAALDYAHARGIVHRDIKPQNLLLRAADDRLLLADFGIAKLVDATSGGQSRSAAIGTIAYMAPEQFQGRVVPATDVYALGCMLYQCLTGAVPYRGTTEQVLYGHLMGAIPSVVAPGQGQIPAGVEAVIARALAKQPTDRFPSAGELAHAFEAALAATPSRPAPPAYDEAPTQVVTTPLPPPQPATPARAAERPAASQPARPILPPWPDPGEPASRTAAPPFPASPARRRGPLVAVFVVALLLIGGGLLARDQGNDGLPASPTTAPVSAVALLPPTATPTVTPTATRTAAPVSAAAFGPTNTPTPAPVSAAPQNAYGPADGSLAHDLNCGCIIIRYASVALRDLEMQATFSNPYAAAEGLWDIGFVFRDDGARQHYRIAVTSGLLWTLYLATGDASTSRIIASGAMPTIKKSAGDSNTLRLLATGTTGQLFLNGAPIATLDLSALQINGRAGIGTGFGSGNQRAGAVTRYADFTVRAAR